MWDGLKLLLKHVKAWCTLGDLQLLKDFKNIGDHRHHDRFNRYFRLWFYCIIIFRTNTHFTIWPERLTPHMQFVWFHSGDWRDLGFNRNLHDLMWMSFSMYAPSYPCFPSSRSVLTTFFRLCPLMPNSPKTVHVVPTYPWPAASPNLSQASLLHLRQLSGPEQRSVKLQAALWCCQTQICSEVLSVRKEERLIYAEWTTIWTVFTTLAWEVMCHSLPLWWINEWN